MTNRTTGRKFLSVILVSFVFGAAAVAQDSTDPSNGSAVRSIAYPVAASTRLEAFLHQTGAVVVEGFSDVGVIQGDDSSSVRTLAIELTNTNSNAKLQGLSIEVRREGDNARVAMAYIDSDEIDPLIDGLNTLSRLDQTATTLSGFDARYRTHGDLELQNSEVNGSREVAIRAAQTLSPSNEVVWATSVMPISRLPDFRQQLIAAKQILEKSRAAAGK